MASLKPRNAMVFLPMTALVIIAIVGGSIWLGRLNAKRLQQNQRVAIERELAELNAGNQTAGGVQVQSVVLPPISVRSVSSGNELTLRPDTRVVELKLLSNPTPQYATYQAVVRRLGAADEFTIANLRVVSDAGAPAITLRLPAHILTRGLYQVSVKSSPSDAKSEPLAEYTFTVIK